MQSSEQDRAGGPSPEPASLPVSSPAAPSTGCPSGRPAEGRGSLSWCRPQLSAPGSPEPGGKASGQTAAEAEGDQCGQVEEGLRCLRN